MTKVTLTDARVRALRPRKTVRDIRDSKLRGFGVRVQPSGARRFFVHSQHRGERVWKIVGDAVTTNVGEARSCAEAMLVAIKRGEDAPRRPKETLFETVAETVFQSYARVWKAWTMTVNRGYLEETASVPLRGASGTGSPPCAPRRWRPTGPCRCSPSSCGKRNGWVTGRKDPTPAGASAAIAGRGESPDKWRLLRIRNNCHIHASHAVMNGVPVPVVSRLLGHSSVRMTLHYAHLAVRDIEDAAERIGQTIANTMNLS